MAASVHQDSTVRPKSLEIVDDRQLFAIFFVVEMGVAIFRRGYWVLWSDVETNLKMNLHRFDAGALRHDNHKMNCAEISFEFEV